MAGLMVELIISWLLLWVFCKRNLLALGIAPNKSRLFQVFFGFLLAAAFCTVYYLSFTVFAHYHWSLNDSFIGSKLLSGSWWTLNSVLYEELIFRGALLYILIEKFGIKTACITSAICFGVYHWFTMGGLGNPVQMAFVFLMTAVWGAMFAIAFAKTRSLYLPVGIHFGWNFISTVIFSQGPLGDQLLTGSGEQQLGGTLSILVTLFQLLAVPLIVFWYLKVLSKKQQLLQTTDLTGNSQPQQGTVQ